MQYKRRQFIQLSGQLAAGLALGQLACNSNSKTDSKTKEPVENGTALTQFGLQLYSVRDDMPNDPKGVLKQLASYGYKQVESYEHDKLGIFWGMSPSEFKKYMDELGMVIVSSHCDINKDFERKAADAASIGMKYLICPSVDAQKDIDGYKKLAAQFNKCGEICKKEGIRFAYHNHDHDFKVLDGQIAQDIFMQDTDAALVDFEIDIYWVVTAGHDPETWLKKYPDRFRLCHIKDRTKGATEREDTCVLGTGSIDFSKVLKTAKANGMEYYIAEQEHYKGTTPMKSMAANAEFLKKLKV